MHVRNLRQGDHGAVRGRCRYRISLEGWQDEDPESRGLEDQPLPESVPVLMAGG